GGHTSTTGLPRSSAVFASAPVTPSSVVKGRASGRMVPRTLRKGNLASPISHLASRVAHLASRGYRPAHAPGLRPVAQPATPRDVRDHRDLAGGEAPQGGGRGRDRSGSGRAGFPHAVHPGGRRRPRYPGGEDPLPRERGDPRAAGRRGEAPVAPLGRPRGQR